jgi:major membrane immunogen (membrane-anchored lipoprotein)
MKLVLVIFISLYLTACSEADFEEFIFRETLKYNLSDTCGKDDQGCKNAVDTQTKSCMVKSNWRQFLKNKDDKDESIRFKKEFYACIVDTDGNPYFELK